MLVCSHGTWVIDILNSILIEQGSIYHGNKKKTCLGKHSCLWPQISNYAMIAPTNQPYRHFPHSNIP